ncbi:MAG: hypothetical protein WAM14_18640 [Candidatus Nitrosopolaris sp.]
MQENRTFPLRACVLVLVLVSALAIAVGSATITHASIIGDFGIGYQDGKNKAYNDFPNTDDDTCPYAGYAGYTSYCTGYIVGYDDELGTLQHAQP